MESVNHLFLFKGKSQTKSPAISPNVSSPLKSQATPWKAFPKPASLLLYSAETSCSRCTCLELSGSHDTDTREGAWFVSPL